MISLFLQLNTTQFSLNSGNTDVHCKILNFKGFESTWKQNEISS